MPKTLTDMVQVLGLLAGTPNQVKKYVGQQQPQYKRVNKYHPVGQVASPCSE